jgi:hypothetical protein
MKQSSFWKCLCLAIAAVGLPALLLADSLVIAGAGFAGKWDTEVDIANVSSNPIQVTLSIQGLPLAVPCPPNCPGKTYDVPARGTITVKASDFLGAIYAGPQMVRVETAQGGPLPVVHARSTSSVSTCEFAELPVVRSASIEAMVVPVLVFPGVVRDGSTYSNLILETLGGAGAVVEVELVDADGTSLGTNTYVIPGESTSSAFTLVDVAKAFGMDTLPLGQVRATMVGGTGVLWGALSTISADGSVRVTVGANP